MNKQRLFLLFIGDIRYLLNFLRNSHNLTSQSHTMITLGLFANTYAYIINLNLKKNASGTFMQFDFTRNGEQLKTEKVDKGKVISKTKRSRGRMRDGYFSNTLSVLVSFVFRQMLRHREIPFSRRPSFALRFYFPFVPFDATSTFSQVTLYSIPTFNGRWIFHRASVSSDCLGGCAKGQTHVSFVPI